MVTPSQLPVSLSKYMTMSENDLLKLIQTFPFFSLPKIAYLLTKPDDQNLLHQVALSSYDRKKVQEIYEGYVAHLKA